ncbi:MAG TPA: TIGR01777 family oxidoreductase [Bacteroidales bacterium]|nr:TIGR01777 family oxidoreductase [Bacteroidales bacterium]
MNETVLITGASGLVGRHLSVLLKENDYRVLAIHRNSKNELIDAGELNQADHIVHLAGANIGEKPWSDAHKSEILNSRVKSSEWLFQKCQEKNLLPKTFVTASAVGFYGQGVSFTETDSVGNGFLANVCKKWEEAADQFQQAGVRTIKIRTGVVLAAEGGILPQTTLPVRMGLGTAFGTGNQIIPWIHIQDLCQLYLRVIQDPNCSGAYNAVAPELTTNRAFIKSLAAFFHKPYWPIPIPGFLIRLVLGERSELLLKGSRVIPSKLVEIGFPFQFPDLSSALKNLYPESD